MTSFTGRLQLDFGDWGASGRIAITLADIRWGGQTLPFDNGNVYSLQIAP